ncbi:MAG: signal peptidase I [Planctomycetaceae bacterium]|nr:signal peptidase I [Planctomycetaceae bacterium]
MDKSQKQNQILSGNSRVDGLYHTAEWLITAFAGTLVFIIFVMQVYRIPTGSMAETLRGAHFRIRCAQCGWRYDYDFISRVYGFADTYTPSAKLPIQPRSPVCPSCKYAEQNAQRLYTGEYIVFKDGKPVPAQKQTVFKGDQIFVLKSIYQFFQPKRWDVIVFKNPVGPAINYIKRCIGLPGETVQLIDGDVFINGQIARKPDKAQEELWMLLYNNDHQPAGPQEKGFFGQSWRTPFERLEDSAWDIAAANGSVFQLSDPGGQIQRILYNDKIGTGFLATYAYDDPAGYGNMPVASDLMMQYYLQMQDGSAGVQIRKYGISYQGWVGADGSMEIVSLGGQEPQQLVSGKARVSDLHKSTRLRMAALDQQIILEYGSSRLVYDLGTGIDLKGMDRTSRPEVQILGRGNLKLTHIALYRDIHYTLVDTYGRGVLRGTQENPMVLKDGEFFACGDNSPASFDSRFWNTPGIANPGVEPYRPGIVPRDYLVGKAFFVHWPGAYRLGTEPIRWIPYVDGMKVIYGGRR